MSVRSLGALSIAVLLFPVIAVAQAVPPRDGSAADPKTGDARIAGRVVAADTGSPLRRALVSASSTTVRDIRLTNTDVEGRYEFRNLPAGRYHITVSKAGYVGLAFGQRRPFESGRPLDLTDAQIAEQIDFALPRGSVITGRITDDAGDPIIGASVQAARYQYLPGGRRRLQAVSQSWLSGMTNDLGEYRLFGLMPGSYVVSAHGQNIGVVSLTQQAPQTGGLGAIDTREGFIQTYYPGTATVAEAQPVLVNLSEEAQASFSLATGRMFRISGVVRRSDDRIPSGSTVTLRPSFMTGGEMGGWGNSPLAPDGSFRFANVPPGQYVLEVAMRNADAADIPEGARVSVAVGGSDVVGLAITTRPGITVSGRVRVAARTPASSTGGAPLRVYAAPANPEDASRGLSRRPGDGLVDESGRFQFRGVTGQVLFRVENLPANRILRSVTLNATDITDTPYDTSNGDVSNLEVALVEPARISATARNARGEPVRDFRVALYPAQARPGSVTTRLTRSGSADHNGRFELDSLPPGEYVALAVEALEQGEEWDPVFQRRFMPAARQFTLQEGQTLSIELPYVE